MRKFLPVFLIFTLVCFLMGTIVACDNANDDEPYAPFTHEIKTISDLVAINDKTGVRFTNATFLLSSDLDLTSENWEGLGLSADVSSAFTGTFDGNNHTITYKIRIAPPEENSLEILPRDAFGVFAYANNAHFKNLNLSVDIEVPCEASSIYIGGLCGYLSGDSSINNVNVTGSISTTIRDLRKEIVYPDGSVSKPNMGGQENDRFYDLYTGGLVGYSKGYMSYSDISSDVDINIGRNRYCIINNVSVGGIAGVLRPVDLSKTNGNALQLNNLNYQGNITYNGGNVYSGGISGSIHHADLKNVSVGQDSEFNFTGNALCRLSLGMVSGLLEDSVLQGASVSAKRVFIGAINTSKKVSFNVGGVAGQLKNTSISYCNSSMDLVVTNGTYFYGGGLVGVCYDSNIDMSVADGGLSIFSSGQTTKSVVDYLFGYSTSKKDVEDFSKNAKNGGVVGRVEGQCIIGEIATEFKAFQPLFGEIANRLEIVTLKKGADVLNDWIIESGYDIELMNIQQTYSKDAKEDEQQYTINHSYKVVDNLKLTFNETNAKVCIDRSKWQQAARDLEDLSVGKSVVDLSTFTALKDDINTHNLG